MNSLENTLFIKTHMVKFIVIKILYFYVVYGIITSYFVRGCTIMEENRLIAYSGQNGHRFRLKNNLSSV
jgi:hypothetical protein